MFKYLGVLFMRDGEMEHEVDQWIGAGRQSSPFSSTCSPSFMAVNIG